MSNGYWVQRLIGKLNNSTFSQIQKLTMPQKNTVQSADSLSLCSKTLVTAGVCILISLKFSHNDVPLNLCLTHISVGLL
jgi:hypothetical protein